MQNKYIFEELSKYFYYDETSPSGLRNKVARGSRSKVGSVQGSVKSDTGHYCITLFNKKYYAHRVIYLLHYGYIDETLFIDHIDGNPANNVISNLRLVTPKQNSANTRKRDDKIKDTPKGVNFRSDVSSKPYRAQIYLEGKTIHLGRFDTAEEAGEAYNKAAKEYFGEFAAIEGVYKNE